MFKSEGIGAPRGPSIQIIKIKNVKNLSSRDKLFKFKFNCNRMENLALKITFQKYGHFSAYFLISFFAIFKEYKFCEKFQNSSSQPLNYEHTTVTACPAVDLVNDLRM